MLPSFFIAHGAPLLAIEDNEYTQFLQQLGQRLQPKAIVLFSAHWESRVQQISDVETYETIYDFGGFPDALYQIKYPAKGQKAIANEIEALFKKQGVKYGIDTNRGLDHGAWVILKMLYPNANIPVISMSVNSTLSPEEQYKIGKSLSVLREKDILIIGSGGTVHNLGALRMVPNEGNVDEWALKFDQWIANHLENWDVDFYLSMISIAPSAELAVPRYGKEHFIPLFYAMGAADQDRKATLLHQSYRYGNLSHNVWQFG